MSPDNSGAKVEPARDWRSILVVPAPYWRSILVVLVISALVNRFEDTKLLLEMQAWSLDLFFRQSAPKTSNPNYEQEIYLVSITDSDYRDPAQFDSHSPLNPERVVALITNVLILKPRVLGIDLDTKDPGWYSVKGLYPIVGRPECRLDDNVPSFLPRSHSRVVWAQTPVQANSHASGSDVEPIQLYQLMGGCKNHRPSLAGTPLFPLDADGVARSYIGEFPLDPEGSIKSFARRIAEEYAASLQAAGAGVLQAAERYSANLKKNGNREKKILNFGVGTAFPRIAASHLLRDPEKNAEDRRWEDGVSQAAGEGKIVLIGGEFEDARDRYDTPLGRIVSGMELNAIAIESELHGNLLREVSKPFRFLADALAGMFVAWVFLKIERLERLGIWLFIAGTILTAVMAIFVSWLFFLGRIWLSFIPIWIGVNIHQYFEHALTVWLRPKPGKPGAA